MKGAMRKGDDALKRPNGEHGSEGKDCHQAT